MHAQISVIIPTLNEAENICNLLQALQPLRDRGHEVIVVDGDSKDSTVTLARTLADRVLQAPRGRAAQMAAGAQQAQGEILWFLHADVLPPQDADQIILQSLASSDKVWGRFDVVLDGTHPLLPIVARMMNLRSRVTGIATGDQGIYVTRSAFQTIGGLPAIPLMEDVRLSILLKRYSIPMCNRDIINVSARRWEKRGVLRTILLMWLLRFSYALGASPERLARMYK